MGWISLSAYWQSVIRGLFLLAVVLLQARPAGGRRDREEFPALAEIEEDGGQFGDGEICLFVDQYRRAP